MENVPVTPRQLVEMRSATFADDMDKMFQLGKQYQTNAVVSVLENHLWELPNGMIGKSEQNDLIFTLIAAIRKIR